MTYRRRDGRPGRQHQNDEDAIDGLHVTSYLHRVADVCEQSKSPRRTVAHSGD